MAVRTRDLIGAHLGDLRYEPIAKRVRAELDGVVVLDSDRAVLVWEPRRVVPTFATPVADVLGELAAASAAPAPGSRSEVGFAVPDVTALRVLDPRVPFDVHTTDGEPVELRAAGGARALPGFRPEDPALAGLVVWDFAGADRWLEEDEEVVSHPRDPFHRVDVRASSRHVQLSLDGQLLADSTRPRLVFETMLPVRYYLPPEDVRAELRPSATRTWCAYKGQASYWSVTVGEGVVPDLVWGYPEPAADAAQLGGFLAFFDERVDLVVDGVPRERPVTPWS